MLSLESLHKMPSKGSYVVHNNVLCCCGYSTLTMHNIFHRHQETVAGSG